MRAGVLFVFFLALAGLALSSPLPKEHEVIDGRKTTIALAIAHQLLGLIPNETVQELLNTILDALDQEAFDYWGQVKDEVTALVGDYINAHNMHQVEVYQQDLQTLMDRYNQAPVESDSYPDKNQQAAALSTSIIAHRYLVEAAELPQSMILHFEDISSIHVIVLKDAAETYSFPDLPPSRWWVDLDEELDHYIAYGKSLKVDLGKLEDGEGHVPEGLRGRLVYQLGVDWRRVLRYVHGQRRVTGEESTCTQLHGTQDCETHCDVFKAHKEQEVTVFLSAKVNDVIAAWEQLKEIAAANAAVASRYYDPTRAH
ncbi:LOW QUALITY PROTEIN: uncharacterized protein LOC119590084 [Penaeus monodon]|uniref:LOW QUALITY PROTEIN: uncharacterized protein LOC119590084 n=1 Tax=Penaeus monodon TaxID=6687 RepID=UPI0018A7CFD8|nr:LOW QUALITY PROTEIN: uncharacterized protein LOC119590084 [Penaeus monodon]